MKDEQSLPVICEKVRLPKNTVKIILEDLKVSDIVKEGSITITKGSDGEDISIDSYYLNANSILFKYISHVELFLAHLDDPHHNGMSVRGVDMWNESYKEELTMNRPTEADVYHEHDEPDHTFTPDTSHLTVDDEDPDWNPEPEPEPVEESRAPFVKPHDPNEDEEVHYELIDPNAEPEE